MGQTGILANPTTEESKYMFGMKSKKEKLQAKYEKLLREAYELSMVDRKKSDEKTAEADSIQKQLDAMD